MFERAFLWEMILEKDDIHYSYIEQIFVRICNGGKELVIDNTGSKILAVIELIGEEDNK